ncbi:MAG: quinone-dependent dihydroorotate dehydrogenase [Rhodospirillaceae bacterium]
MYGAIRPLVFRLDPERAHDLSLRALETGIVSGPGPVADPALEQRLFGLTFANPVGLAAGYDKDARVPMQTLGLGFGFTEIGSVTPEPQPGNPKPRLFRLSRDAAAINRYGFNSQGMAAAAWRLAALPPRGQRPGPIGVNLGKNKTSADAAADYVAGVRALGPYADYLVVNVSSPNTPGLRALQDRGELQALLGAVKAALADLQAPPPLLLKVAPDLTDDDKRDIAAVALEVRLDGLIATNTTIERPTTLADPQAAETGGLSGRPLFELSTRVLADLYRLTEGRIPLVGAGGVASADDAYKKIRAGASLVQLYTALVYEGPGLAARVVRGLARRLADDGFSRVSEAIGAGHR